MPPEKVPSENEERTKQELPIAALFLRSERKTRKKVDALVQEASASVLYDMSLKKAQTENSSSRDAALLAAVALAAVALRAKLKRALSDGQAYARHLARGIFQKAVPEAPPPEVSLLRLESSLDALRAEASANAIADAWTRATSEAALKGTAKALDEARKSVAPKVDANVTTEHAQAFNDGLVRIEEATRGAMEDAGLKPDWLWRWSAVMDKRTCPLCADLDGREMDPQNPEHHPPLHPRCRCFLVLVRLSSRSGLFDLYTRKDGMDVRPLVGTPRRKLPMA